MTAIRIFHILKESIFILTSKHGFCLAVLWWRNEVKALAESVNPLPCRDSRFRCLMPKRFSISWGQQKLICVHYLYIFNLHVCQTSPWFCRVLVLERDPGDCGGHRQCVLEYEHTRDEWCGHKLDMCWCHSTVEMDPRFQRELWSQCAFNTVGMRDVKWKHWGLQKDLVPSQNED